MTDPAQAPAAVAQLGFAGSDVPIVVVGGADQIQGKEAAQAMSDSVVLPVAERMGAAVVTGGTDSGLMRIVGLSARGHPTVPVIGVAAEGTIVEADGGTAQNA